MTDKPEIDPAIRALYPGRDDTWLAEAQENLKRYAAAVLRQGWLTSDLISDAGL